MRDGKKFGELSKLSELHQAGVLSDEEYALEKLRILESDEGRTETSDGAYVPGSFGREAATTTSDGATSRGGFDVKKVAMTLLRIWLAVNTVGISELVLYLIRRRRQGA